MAFFHSPTPDDTAIRVLLLCSCGGGHECSVRAPLTYYGTGVGYMNLSVVMFCSSVVRWRVRNYKSFCSIGEGGGTSRNYKTFTTKENQAHQSQPADERWISPLRWWSQASCSLGAIPPNRATPPVFALVTRGGRRCGKCYGFCYFAPYSPRH